MDSLPPTTTSTPAVPPRGSSSSGRSLQQQLDAFPKVDNLPVAGAAPVGERVAVPPSHAEARALLARLSVGPLDDAAVRAVQAWMAAAAAADGDDSVQATYEAHLDAVFSPPPPPSSTAGGGAAATAATTTGGSGSSGGVMGFLGRVMKKSSSTAAARQGDGASGGASAFAPPPSCADVRLVPPLSSHVVTLTCDHICDASGATVASGGGSRRSSNASALMGGEAGAPVAAASRPASDQQLRTPGPSLLGAGDGGRGARHERSQTVAAVPSGAFADAAAAAGASQAFISPDAISPQLVAAAAANSTPSQPHAGADHDMDPLPLRMPLAVEVVVAINAAPKGSGGSGGGSTGSGGGGSSSGASKARVTLRPLPRLATAPAYVAVAEPASVTLRRHETARFTVSVQLLQPGALLEAPLLLEVDGGAAPAGYRQLVLLRALGEVSLFGRPLEALPIAPGDSGGYAGIPAPLAALREQMVGADDSAAATAPHPLDTEGLFRLAPGGADVRAGRRLLNEGRMRTAANPGGAPIAPITAAHLLKLLLRELPSPLLAAVPTETLLGAATDEQCREAAARYLPAPHLAVLQWLTDLLVEVAAHERANKMGARALATVVGPNLFSLDAGVNPMAALMASTKAVAFLARLIAARQRELQPPPAEEGGGGGATAAGTRDDKKEEEDAPS